MATKNYNVIDRIRKSVKIGNYTITYPLLKIDQEFVLNDTYTTQNLQHHLFDGAVTEKTPGTMSPYATYGPNVLGPAMGEKLYIGNSQNYITRLSTVNTQLKLALFDESNTKLTDLITGNANQDRFTVPSFSIFEDPNGVDYLRIDSFNVSMLISSIWTGSIPVPEGENKETNLPSGNPPYIVKGVDGVAWSVSATFPYSEPYATILGQCADIILGNSQDVDTDPYSGGGTSDTGGGTGNFDNSSDTIPIPSLPSISGLNTGFFTAFVATTANMQDVANYLWTTLIPDIEQGGVISQVIDSLKKVVSNPYDAIMGCSIIPVTPSTGGSKELKMYGVIQTGITIPYASSRWVTVDCGTLNINEYWGAYLDYSPYTKTTSLYLPYIGTVSIDIDLIMGKALQVVYHVDILSGICIAYILVNGSVEFLYQGHCATTIPITTADFTSAIQSGLGLVGNVANIVSAGAGGGAVGGLGGAVLGAVGSAVSQSPAIASNVMNMKPDIKSGGGIGGAGGILGVQKPYLIVERPRQSAPKAQNTYTGYPCNIALSVKDCTGYTEFETINLDGVLLTGEEKDELQQILQRGVYL